MADRKSSYTLNLPALLYTTSNKDLFEFVKEEVMEPGFYPSIIPLFFAKLYADPNIIDLRESVTDVKLSKTIDGLANLATIINDIREQFNREVAEIKKIANKSNTDYVALSNTVSEVFSILKSSNEGLEQLKTLSSALGDRFDSLSNVAEMVASGTLAASTAELNFATTSPPAPAVEAIQFTNTAQFVPSQDDDDELAGLEDEDFGGGLGSEDMKKVLDRYRDHS